MSGIIGTSHSKSKVIGRSLDTAKAWVSLDQLDSHDIRASYNISSIADQGTGHSRFVYFSPIRLSTGYCILGSALGNTLNGSYQTAISSGTANSTTGFDVMFKIGTASATDVNAGSVAVFR